jgi:acetyl-CoA carboxylase carboxyltransferase component
VKDPGKRARSSSLPKSNAEVRSWHELVANLDSRRTTAEGMGGEERVERQHSLGKLTVRERLELLVDEGSWVEYGLLADSMDPTYEGRFLAADGAVTGVGRIEGRPVAVAAYDFTVLAGSMGRVGEQKIKRMRELALRERMPMVWLLDSAGARIQSQSGSTFAGMGDLFREQVTMSGVVPMVAAMLGHCAAGTAYIPALADFVAMVKGTSSMALGGRHLVKAAVGEDVSEEEMGGSAVHTKISGCADLEVADDRQCLAIVREYLSFFPSSNGDDPPCVETEDPCDRRVEELYDIVPTAPRRAYDVRRVVQSVVDDGHVFWIKPEWAKNIVTGLARFGGRPVGILGPRWCLGCKRCRQGGPVRLAVRCVQHPAGVPPRRARVHRRLSSRAARDYSARCEDAVRRLRGDGAEDQRCDAQELRRRLLRDERVCLRARLPRRVADSGDRGDGSRRCGQHHSSGHVGGCPGGGASTETPGVG